MAESGRINQICEKLYLKILGSASQTRTSGTKFRQMTQISNKIFVTKFHSDAVINRNEVQPKETNQNHILDMNR